MTTKINLSELLSDREAGTGGPWSYNSWDEFGERIDGKNGYAVVSAKWMGGSSVDLDINPSDARRIARLPTLEAAYIEAVGEIQRMRDFISGLADNMKCEQFMSLPPKCIRAYRAREFLGDGE